MKQIVQLTIFALIVGTAGFAFAQRGGHRGPPPEAFEACEDLEDGDACTVETPHGTVEGTCGTGALRGDALYPERSTAARRSQWATT